MQTKNKKYEIVNLLHSAYFKKSPADNQND